MTTQSETRPFEDVHPLRRLETSEAREYAEWCLLVHDLERCLHVANLWKDIDKDGDREVAISLFRDAVISFVACFDKNNTIRLDPQSLYSPWEGGNQYFRWLSALRDSWIAHRYGASRQTSAAIVVDKNSGDFLGIGNLMMTYTRPVFEGTDDFILFISIALNHAKAKRNGAKEAFEAQAKSLTSTQRLRLPIANTKAATDGELRLGRKKFANVTRLTAKHLGDLNRQAQEMKEEG